MRLPATKWVRVAHCLTGRAGRAGLPTTLALLLATIAARGAPARIHLRGGERLDVHAGRSQGRLTLAGNLLDDLGRPVAAARIGLAVLRGGAPVGLSDAQAAACGEATAPPALERADALLLTTSEGGRFCVRLGLPVDRYIVRLEARPAGLLDGASAELAVDLFLPPVTLRFDPEPRIVSLDDEAAIVEVVASSEDDDVTSAAPGLLLALSSETGAALGAATTDASGRARFTVPSSRLGSPGPGQLRVAFEGSALAGAAAISVRVERRTHVSLGTPDAVDARLPPAVLGDSVSVRVVAVAQCQRTGCTGSPTGSVEARIDDVLAGAAPLQGGATPVTAYLPETAGDLITLRVRYVPDAPWFVAAPELTVTQPIRPPSPWRRVPLVLAGLLALGWLVLARLPARRAATARPPSPQARPEASVVLVRAGATEQGWRGVLTDAHEGSPVGAGRVAVERRGFERLETVAETVADADGAFTLPSFAPRTGDELVAEGRLHAPVRRPLPGAGELAIALVLRRRALLDRLVAWARQRGRPYDARPEPTPGHVRRAASGEPAVAEWAGAVERAAFGGAPFDARAEAEIERLAPDGDPPRPVVPGAR